MEQEPKNPQPQQPGGSGAWLAIGLSMGAALGAAFDNIAIGMAVGLAVGVALDAARNASRGQPGEEPPSTPPEPGPVEPASRPNQRSSQRSPGRVMFNFSLAMLVFAAALIASILVLPLVEVPAVRVLIALLPVLPAAFGLQAIRQGMAAQDELAKRILLESLTFSLTSTAMLALVIGLLENAGLPQPNWVWLIPVICFFWLVGQWITGRRYQ